MNIPPGRVIEKASSSKVTLWLPLGLLLLNLLLWVLSALSLGDSRSQYAKTAEVTTRNVAQLLEHDIAALVDRIDLALQTVQDEYKHETGAGQFRDDAFNTFIAAQHAHHAVIDAIRVTRADGLIAYGVGVVPGARVSLADLDFFLTLRDDPAAKLVISEPVFDRTSGKNVLVFARRIRGADGSFAGVAYATVAMTSLSKTFRSVDLGHSGTITLFGSSMRILTRQPEPHGEGSLAGTRFGSPSLQALVKADKSEGTYLATSTVDNIPRTYSYRRVAGTTLNVSVGQASDDYLAAWRKEAAKTLGLVLSFGLMTLFLSWLISRAWKKQIHAAAALRGANQTLAAEQELNRTLIHSAPLAIYARDRKGLVTVWNEEAERMFGWSADEILGRLLPSVPEEGRAESEDLRRRILSGERVVQAELLRQRRDGSLLEISSTLSPLRNASGEIYGFLAIAVDITERKAAQQRIEFLAHHDALTRLPNRLLVQDRFQQAIAQARRTQSQVALVFLDLDNFKSINDSLGHLVGDTLLEEIAIRLGDCVRSTDTISRQGGDEFLILLCDLPDGDAIASIVAMVHDRLQHAFTIGENELLTSASIGVSVYPQDGDNFDTLLKKADLAMYKAKDAGRNACRFFDELMNKEADNKLALRSGLKKALERNEFEIHYQPVIDLATESIVGAEALIRWRRPDLGLIPPNDFIPVAEESGLIIPIGEWVLHEACRQAVEWRKAGLPDLLIAVNLSAVQFQRGDVERAVVSALSESGLDPFSLELEITESILIQDVQDALEAIRRLKSLGVKLAIDDFGTGYSSLSYLKRFDVDKLKIDQSFVRDLSSDPDDVAIVRAIIEMAHSLGLVTVAEGVENAEVLSLLRRFGCDKAQGYYFGAPMPASEFMAFVLKERALKSIRMIAGAAA
ncbi:MAG: sensory box/GGDEF family protein [Herminiimonas sp.]|nr:sensory box/GGDEF family protein [Herminiimonas sp.]